MPSFLVRTDTGERWAVEETNVIGRHPNADIYLDAPNVSRQHAMIRTDDEGATFFDLDSANGSDVNGNPVRGPVVLQDGDIIHVADVTLQFRDSSLSRDLSDSGPMDATMMLSVETKPMIFLVGDIVGYTEISAKIPEKDLAAIMAPWYQKTRDIIKTAGGHVDKFIGDCVFAYWRGNHVTTTNPSFQRRKTIGGFSS